MELFRGKNRRENPDIEFINKSKPKKLELVPKKKRSGDLYMPHLVSEEPMMRQRWLLEIPFETGIEEYSVSFARPSMTSERDEIPYMSTSTWGPGRMRWNDLYLEFRDYQSHRGLMEWFQITTESITGRNGYGFKKDMSVESLDPTGIVVEKWHLQGCTPTELHHHQESAFTEPVMGVNFSIDRAILNT